MLADKRRLNSQDAIWPQASFDGIYHIGVNVVDRGPVRAWSNLAILIQVGLDLLEDFGPQSVFHLATTARTSDIGM